MLCKATNHLDIGGETPLGKDWMMTELMTTYDHTVDGDVARELVATPGIIGQHSAWDFCGYVHYGEDGLWHEEVWIRNVPVKTISAPDLEALMGLVNGEFGSE